MEFHFILISCFCFWSKPTTPHKYFIVCSVTGMELFSICEWSNFMLSRALSLLWCVYTCVCVRVYFITNCVFCYCCFSLFAVRLLFVYWFSPDPTSAIFHHHCFHEFPLNIVWNMGRRDISYPWWTFHVHSDHFLSCVKILVARWTWTFNMLLWCVSIRVCIVLHLSSHFQQALVALESDVSIHARTRVHT